MMMMMMIYSHQGSYVVKSVGYAGQICCSAIVWNLLGHLCVVEFFQSR
jgi:hypothetical protein